MKKELVKELNKIAPLLGASLENNETETIELIAVALGINQTPIAILEALKKNSMTEVKIRMIERENKETLSSKIEDLETIVDKTIEEVKNLKEDEEIYPPLENVVEEEITDKMRKEFEIASKLIKKRELEEVEKLTKKKECKVQNSCEAKEDGLVQISKDIHQLSKDINLCNNAILKGNNTILDFRISSHKANVHVGSELKDIHKFQGKFVFLALLLNALVFTAFGIVLDSNKNDILPYVNSAINFAKTANSISSR